LKRGAVGITRWRRAGRAPRGGGGAAPGVHEQRGDAAGADPQLPDDLGCGQRLRQLVGLPSPQVERLGVAAAPCRGAQRTGYVVDLRIAHRGVRAVLDHESVHDPPGQATGEGAGKPRRPLLAQQLAMGVVGARLGCQHQRRAEESGDAEHSHLGDGRFRGGRLRCWLRRPQALGRRCLGGRLLGCGPTGAGSRTSSGWLDRCRPRSWSEQALVSRSTTSSISPSRSGPANPLRFDDDPIALSGHEDLLPSHNVVHGRMVSASRSRRDTKAGICAVPQSHRCRG